jgi:hypothetical protein
MGSSVSGILRRVARFGVEREVWRELLVGVEAEERERLKRASSTIWMEGGDGGAPRELVELQKDCLSRCGALRSIEECGVVNRDEGTSNDECRDDGAEADKRDGNRVLSDSPRPRIPPKRSMTWSLVLTEERGLTASAGFEPCVEGSSSIPTSS